MVELVLSTDGKHSVRVSAKSVAEAAEVLPEAQRLLAQLRARPAASPRANQGEAPVCPVHQTPMVLRHGRNGDFWSCNQKLADGSWCKEKQNA
jgi:hypothetical protein